MNNLSYDTVSFLYITNLLPTISSFIFLPISTYLFFYPSCHVFIHSFIHSYLHSCIHVLTSNITYLHPSLLPSIHPSFFPFSRPVGVHFLVYDTNKAKQNKVDKSFSGTLSNKYRRSLTLVPVPLYFHTVRVVVYTVHFGRRGSIAIL